MPTESEFPADDPALFDRLVDRRQTGSMKWAAYAGTDIIPMWVADMDIPAPPAVLEALHRQVDHGIFGYARPTDELVAVALGILERDHAIQALPEALVWLPGLVSGLHVACASIGEPGDAILVMTPSYPPFLSAPGAMGRRCLTVPLQDATGTIDFAAVEAALADAGNRCRGLMLCNPHNPTGRVYDRQTLLRLGELAERYDLTVVSDEIHAGLVLEPGLVHTSLAALAPELARRCLTMIAPSKTYNTAGLGCALAVIPDPNRRTAFQRAAQGLVPGVNALGYVAALAAWRDGEHWRQALVAYLRANRDRLVAAVNAHPGLAVQAPQATYLAWVDCRGLEPADPRAAFEAAGIGPSDGRPFAGEGFVRLNFGCPRATLDRALERLPLVGSGISSD